MRSAITAAFMLTTILTSSLPLLASPAYAAYETKEEAFRDAVEGLCTACMEGNLARAQKIIAHLKGLGVAPALVINADHPSMINGTGFNALSFALTKQNLPLVNLLLAEGANPRIYSYFGDGSLMSTPLHQAAGGGDASIVKALLVHGADPSVRDAKGRTPAQLATAPNVKRLLEQAASRRSRRVGR